MSIKLCSVRGVFLTPTPSRRQSRYIGTPVNVKIKLFAWEKSLVPIFLPLKYFCKNKPSIRKKGCQYVGRLVVLSILWQESADVRM